MLERKKGGGVRQLEPEVLEGCGACGEGSIGVVEQGKVARHETLTPSQLYPTTGKTEYVSDDDQIMGYISAKAYPRTLGRLTVAARGHDDYSTPAWYGSSTLTTVTLTYLWYDARYQLHIA